MADQLANRKKRDDGTDDPKSKPDFSKFKQLRSYFENHPVARFRIGEWRLLTRKGALPYEYISP